MSTSRSIALPGYVLLVIAQLCSCNGGAAGPDNVSVADADVGADSDIDSGTNTDTDTDTDPAPDPDPDPDPEETCANTNFEVEEELVDMLIVLDRSNSMKTDGLWEPMGEALTEVTAAMSQQINFGLLLFPDLRCMGTFFQCDAPTREQVAIGERNAAEKIATAVSPDGGVGTCGGTPTARTLATALRTLSSMRGDNQRYVLLATDGGPNCNDALSCSTCTTTLSSGDCQNPGMCLDNADTIDAARALADAGYPVYVLGMGGSAQWASVMNDIAEAGGTGSYYPVGNTTGLLRALTSITGEVVSCNFDVDWSALPPDASEDPSKVNFYCKQSPREAESDENRLGYDEGCRAETGWSWVDEDTVEFCESACEDLKNQACDVVTATFGCESIPVD